MKESISQYREWQDNAYHCIAKLTRLLRRLGIERRPLDLTYWSATLELAQKMAETHFKEKWESRKNNT
jgi:hypothetical protein